MILASICPGCARWRGGPHCDAYPEGIPEEILRGGVDHRSPRDGDRGITFSPRPDREAALDAYEDWRLSAQERVAAAEAKHLPGRHDQRSHGRTSGGGGGLALLDRMPEVTVVPASPRRVDPAGPVVPDWPREGLSRGGMLDHPERFERLTGLGQGATINAAWVGDKSTGRRMYVKLGHLGVNEARNEAFASRLKRRLGLPSGRSEVGATYSNPRFPDGGEDWAVIEHVDDSPDMIEAGLRMEAVGDEYAVAGGQRDHGRVDPQSIVDAQVFDYLSDEGDRHNGNWLMMRDEHDIGVVTLIDHSLAFGGSNDPKWGRAAMEFPSAADDAPVQYFELSASKNALNTMLMDVPEDVVVDALRRAIGRLRDVDFDSIHAETYGDLGDGRRRQSAELGLSRLKRRAATLLDLAGSEVALRRIAAELRTDEYVAEARRRGLLAEEG